MKSNKHKISSDMVTTFVIVLIMVVVLFEVLAALFPVVTSAGDTLQASSFPLGDLFASGGAIWYILAAAVVLILFRSLKSGK